MRPIRFRDHSVQAFPGLLDTVLDALIIIDEAGAIVAWNAVAEQTFGWSAAEVVGSTLGERIVPLQYRAAHRAGMARFLATGEAHVLNRRIEIYAVDKAGREFPVELSVVSLFDGEQRLFAGFLRDLSVRRDAEEKLALSEATLRLATEAAEIGTWDLDLMTDTLVWSDRTKAMFGISAGVHCSMQDFYAGLHPDDHDTTIAAFHSALDPARRATYDVQYRTIGKEDGVLRWVAAKGRGVFDDAGRCVRAIGTAIDITARRAAEERLRESEGFTRLLLDSTAEAFYAVDTQGSTTLCNQAFLRMLGFASFDDVVGRKLHDIIHHSHPDGTRYDVADCPIYRAAATGNLPIVVSDELFYRQDGSAFPVEYRAAPIFDRGVHKGAICTFVDISERRRAEEQRELLLHELEHRVKNLFAVASSIITMSARSASSVEAMTSAVLGRLSALARAHALARPTAGDLQLAQVMTLHDLIDLVTQPHNNLDHRARGRVTLAGPDVAVSGEAITILSLVFHELATNAAKYGGLSTVDGTLQVSWAVAENRLHLAWTESGGPEVAGAPGSTGFGTRLAELSIVNQLKGAIAVDWRPSGIRVAIDVPLELLAL